MYTAEEPSVAVGRDVAVRTGEVVRVRVPWEDTEEVEDTVMEQEEDTVMEEVRDTLRVEEAHTVPEGLRVVGRLPVKLVEEVKVEEVEGLK